jgi:hypothetical protein
MGARGHKEKKVSRRQQKNNFKRYAPWLVAVLVLVVVVLYIGINWQISFKRSATVGIVDQFYNQSPGFTDNATKMLDKLGINYEVYKDSEVTVELYKKLPTFGYKLLIMRVHSGINPELHHSVFLFTAENYTTQEYTYEQLTDQIRPGVIDLSRPNNPVFSVGPLFVLSSMMDRFNGTLIIISSCYGLNNTLLADSLIDKGASSIVSWTYLVGLDRTDTAILGFLKAYLEDGLTINESVETAIKGVGPDSTYDSTLKYYPDIAGTNTWNSTKIS